MKECPACKTQYTDDTLSFCLQDGSALIDVYQSDLPTLVTSLPSDGMSRQPNESTPTVIRDNAPVPSTVAIDAKRPNTVIAVLVTVIVMLFIFGIVGVIGFVFLNRDTKIAANEANVTVQPAGSANVAEDAAVTPKSQPSKTPVSTPTTNSNSTVPPMSSVDRSLAENQVSQQIESWRTQAESRNLQAFMSHYAPAVDYYRRNGATRTFVRADKQQAFSKFDSIRINITNLKISLDASGTSASVTFDKEWDFSGDGNTSGKVQQLLRLRNIDGQWLITAEKDLKVY